MPDLRRALFPEETSSMNMHTEAVNDNDELCNKSLKRLNDLYSSYNNATTYNMSDVYSVYSHAPSVHDDMLPKLKNACILKDSQTCDKLLACIVPTREMLDILIEYDMLYCMDPSLFSNDFKPKPHLFIENLQTLIKFNETLALYVLQYVDYSFDVISKYAASYRREKIMRYLLHNRPPDKETLDLLIVHNFLLGDFTPSVFKNNIQTLITYNESLALTVIEQCACNLDEAFRHAAYNGRNKIMHHILDVYKPAIDYHILCAIMSRASCQIAHRVLDIVTIQNDWRSILIELAAPNMPPSVLFRMMKTGCVTQRAMFKACKYNKPAVKVLCDYMSKDFFQSDCWSIYKLI